MNHTEIVKKLIGPIYPYGSKSIDDERFENLKKMCELVNDLVTEIDRVSQLDNRPELSIKEMGCYANKFMTETLGIE